MFQSHWIESALDKLADVYVAANLSERDRMTASVELLNAQLATNPLELGESRVGGYRVVFLPLLVVYYHVDEANRQVRVTDVIRYGQ